MTLDEFSVALRCRCAANLANPKKGYFSVSKTEAWGLTGSRKSSRMRDTEFDRFLLEARKSGEIAITNGRIWPRRVALAVSTTGVITTQETPTDPRQVAMFEGGDR